ncbi:MAG: tetratricopeptide repeat protein, partial [Anaerolineaceae bacterium]|nr:tetratricopeptide repeat protein [Anaerolineaceae bacterium]
DNLIILPFDKALANITYDRFVKEYIAGIIRAKHIVVGFNHHFGKDRKGTFENLLKSAGEFGIRAERLNQVIINNYREGKARAVVLSLLEILGANDPQARKYRSELMSVLY